MDDPGTRGATAEEDLAAVDPDGDHAAARRVLEDRGWRLLGAGDWAVALRSPDGTTAARISPFDPTSPFTVDLYRRGAALGVFPRVLLHLPLEGGADLQAMELLEPVDPEVAAAFHRGLAAREPALRRAADLISAVHAEAAPALPFLGPVDDNPANVMRAADGGLRITDVFFADGPRLYGSLLTDPMLVAAAIPPGSRRHLLELPLASSGPWDPAVRAAMAAALADADAALAGSGT